MEVVKTSGGIYYILLDYDGGYFKFRQFSFNRSGRPHHDFLLDSEAKMAIPKEYA